MCLRYRIVSPAQALRSWGVHAGASKHTAPLFFTADPTFGGDLNHRCTLFRRLIFSNLLVCRMDFFRALARVACYWRSVADAASPSDQTNGSDRHGANALLLLLQGRSCRSEVPK
jgi:hypothetical protein